MADNGEDNGESRATGPTYKSLFIGACLIIGSAFGWWFTNFISYVEALTARLAIVEIRGKEFEWTFKINTEKINQHEERLRQVERDHERYTNGKRGAP